MGKRTIAFVSLLAISASAHAGFDYWYQFGAGNSTELRIRNRGIGGMFGAGIQTGSKLLAIEMEYTGQPVVFGSLPFNPPVVDLENALNEPARSQVRLGHSPFVFSTQPGLDQPAAWSSIQQFSVTVANILNPINATAPGGYAFSRLVPAGNYLTGSAHVKAGGDVGPAIDLVRDDLGVIYDGLYLSDLSFDVTLTPTVASGTTILSDHVDGFQAWTDVTVTSHNPPDFLSLNTVVSPYAPLSIVANRDITAADAGIYVAQLEPQYVQGGVGGGGGGGGINFTIQVLPEPGAAALLYVTAFTAAHRRRTVCPVRKTIGQS